MLGDHVAGTYMDQGSFPHPFVARLVQLFPCYSIFHLDLLAPSFYCFSGGAQETEKSSASDHSVSVAKDRIPSKDIDEHVFIGA